MLISLGRELAAELRTARSEVTGPADQLDDSVLVHRLPLTTDGNEITVPVRAEIQVVGVDRKHRCRGLPTRISRSVNGVIHAATKNHVSRSAATVELQTRETCSHSRISGGADPLDCL